jgi:hypothetical protein
MPAVGMEKLLEPVGPCLLLGDQLSGCLLGHGR